MKSKTHQLSMQHEHNMQNYMYEIDCHSAVLLGESVLSVAYLM